MRPGNINMMFCPREASCFSWPLRKPSPSPTSSSSEPTPQAIPNMVRNERSLCAQRVDSDCRTMSRSIRIKDCTEENMPPHLRGGAWGPRVTFRRGVSIPPNHLIRDTQPGALKFPAGILDLDPEDGEKVSWRSSFAKFLILMYSRR